MNIQATIITLLTLGFCSQLYAQRCADAADTFEFYDSQVKSSHINNLSSDYYILSYSWSARYCRKVSSKSKKSGAKNYLQCASGYTFGYILHGLWPQGAINTKQKYPRACAGDQPKISRAVLAPYLCMTPSVWLLQHAYEYHGTCMPDKRLKTPQGYFNRAYQLHQKIKLPNNDLPEGSASLQWWYKNNPQLKAGAVQFWRRAREWQICYDRDFKSMRCPGNKRSGFGTAKWTANSEQSRSKSLPKNVLIHRATQPECLIKGNISKKSQKKLYFATSHPQYAQVVIDKRRGERCFRSEKAAVKAGWVKAQ